MTFLYEQVGIAAGESGPKKMKAQLACHQDRFLALLSLLTESVFISC